jgi:hypothetical protein
MASTGIVVALLSNPGHLGQALAFLLVAFRERVQAFQQGQLGGSTGHSLPHLGDRRDGVFK